MSNTIKLHNLTANLKNSQEYGSKILKQIEKQAELQFSIKLNIAKIKKAIQSSAAEQQQLQTLIHNDQKQANSYNYKRQKIAIKVQQYQRKVELQESLLQKKIVHNQQLQEKIADVASRNTGINQKQDEINQLKQQLDELNTTIHRQDIEIQNLHAEQMLMKKKCRDTEDEIGRAKTQNDKKRRLLHNLDNNALSLERNQSADSQNHERKRQQQRIERLKLKLESVIQDNQRKLASIDSAYTIIASIVGENQYLKHLVREDQQILKDAKAKKKCIFSLRKISRKIGNKQNYIKSLSSADTNQKSTDIFQTCGKIQ